jgi:hypothetical protein
LARDTSARSFYLLEISIEPGGGRREERFVYNRPHHIRSCLAQEFLTSGPEHRGFAAEMAADYGEVIALWVIQEGRLVDGLDLRPFLSVRLGDNPPIRLDQRARLGTFSRKVDAGEGFSRSDISFDIDWAGIAKRLPQLQGKLLQPGEETDFILDKKILKKVKGSLLLEELYDAEELAEEGEEPTSLSPIRYGYNDMEAGAFSGDDDGPTFIDPDSPREVPRRSSKKASKKPAAKAKQPSKKPAARKAPSPKSKRPSPTRRRK